MTEIRFIFQDFNVAMAEAMTLCAYELIRSKPNGTPGMRGATVYKTFAGVRFVAYWTKRRTVIVRELFVIAGGDSVVPPARYPGNA